MEGVREMTPEQQAEYEQAENARIQAQDSEDRRWKSNWIANLKRSAGVPDRYADASLESFVAQTAEQREMLADLEVFEKGVRSKSQTSMALIGPVGTGKTWIGCAIVNDLVLDEVSALIVTAKRYTGMIRESYRKDSQQSEFEILDRYATARLLVLDEIGRQFDTDAERMYLFDLIDERYKRMLPTVFLSNLTADEFKAFLGDAILDRIREGGGRIRVLNWASRRGAK